MLCALSWSGLRCGIPFATGSQGFPETPLDVTRQGLFYQTSTAVFRSSCFFNSLLRCSAPTIIQKTFGEVWRSVSKTCSLHCGASTGHRLVSTVAWYFAWVEFARGSLVPCQRNFFLVKEMHDSILEFRFLHCKFTCRTLGEEDTCMETTSNISSAWTPTTNLGHEIGNFLQVQGFGQLGNCGEKCGPMGLSVAVFPGFLLHVVISSTFCERCL